MNPIEILQEFGVPVAFCLGLSWFIYKQNKYIQDDLTKDLHHKFHLLEKIINEDLRNIIIALINQQKKMQIELRGIKSKYEALVEIVNKLIIRNDKK
tara:strand:- start:53 stop:343 length:291 start_codon:yes stop_codon:yes gene_type:complete